MQNYTLARCRYGRFRLFQTKEIEKHTLANGVRILVDASDKFASTSIAVCLLGGSREESRETIGRTHLLEHMLFKRTSRKDTQAIANIIDELGGGINALTDTDSLCLCGESTAKDSLRVLELFAELLFEPAFTDHDLSTEKEVVRQEIIEAEDEPEQSVYQRFSENFWPMSSLGFPVIGYRETVGSFSRQELLWRLNELTVGPRVIVAVAGNISAVEVLKYAEKYYSYLPKGALYMPEKPRTTKGSDILPKPVNQVYLTWGRPAPGLRDEDYLKTVLISHALGDGMSSRLFQLLRERYGLAYEVNSELDVYMDTAALLVNATIERSNINLGLKLISEEFNSLISHGLKEDEFQRSQKSVCAILGMEADSLGSRMWRLVESETCFGRYRSLAEVQGLVNSISLDEVNSFLRTEFMDEQGFLQVGGDVENYVLPESVRELLD